MYEFNHLYIFVKNNGIPLYIGNEKLTEEYYVWWMPTNWVVIPVLIIVGLCLMGINYIKSK